jgi:hypothetical protein
MTGITLGEKPVKETDKDGLPDKKRHYVKHDPLAAHGELYTGPGHLDHGQRPKQPHRSRIREYGDFIPSFRRAFYEFVYWGGIRRRRVSANSAHCG